MRRLLSHLLDRAEAHLRAHTTFCDECGQVCTPACRQDALHERIRDEIRQAALYRR